MNISPCVDIKIPLLPSNMMRYVILGAMHALILLLFDNSFVYWNIIPVGDTVSPEDNFLLKSDGSDMKMFKLFSSIERCGG